MAEQITKDPLEGTTIPRDSEAAELVLAAFDVHRALFDRREQSGVHQWDRKRLGDHSANRLPLINVPEVASQHYPPVVKEM